MLNNIITTPPPSLLPTHLLDQYNYPPNCYLLPTLAETLRCREVTRAYLHGTSTAPTSPGPTANSRPSSSPSSGASLGASPSPVASTSPSPSLGPSPRPRASLKRVLFLVDGRHGLKHTDATFLQATTHTNTITYLLDLYNYIALTPT